VRPVEKEFDVSKTQYQAVTRASAEDLADVIPSQEDVGWKVVAITQGPGSVFTAFMVRPT
jgi:hypothetical protein